MMLKSAKWVNIWENCSCKADSNRAVSCSVVPSADRLCADCRVQTPRHSVHATETCKHIGSRLLCRLCQKYRAVAVATGNGCTLQESQLPMTGRASAAVWYTGAKLIAECLKFIVLQIPSTFCDLTTFGTISATFQLAHARLHYNHFSVIILASDSDSAMCCFPVTKVMGLSCVENHAILGSAIWT